MSLILRKIQEKDLQKIMEWRALPEVTRYMYTDPKLTLEIQKEWYHKIMKSKNGFYWIIEFDDVSIGMLTINEIDEVNKKCSWGYYIGDISFRGKGIARILECNVYDYVFYELNLNKLCSEVFEFNGKVIAIHKKFGSEIEGILKDHIRKNNKFYNVVAMGITKQRWDSIKEQYEYEKILIE